MTAATLGPTRTIRAAEQGGIFKLLVGDHLDVGPTGCDCDNCIRSNGTDHRYCAIRYNHKTSEPWDHAAKRAMTQEEVDNYTNDIIVSKNDLDIRFNSGPGSRKFERLQEWQLSPAQRRVISGEKQPAPTVTGDKTAWHAELDRMNLESLQAQADTLEVPHKGKKEDELRKILKTK